jgi:cytochrome P450
MAERYILEVKSENKTDFQSSGERMTLLRHLINSNLPERELSTARLVNEVQVLLAAGTTGTSRVLDFICYHVLANTGIRQKMAEELREVMLDWPNKKPTWSQLEKLSYFQAVIKEGLR